MFDGRTKLAIEVLDEVHRHFPERVFRTQIPRNIRLSEAPSYGKPAILFDVKSRGAQAYLSLARELQGIPHEQARTRPRPRARCSARPGRAMSQRIPRQPRPPAVPPAGRRRAARGLPQIPVASIRPNPFQPRTTFAPEGLEELRASIATFGVLVPIIVRERPDGYELIAGERRWRAAQAAGLETIPAIVRAADDRESLEVAIIENLQRENLDPLEEAMGFST